MRKCEKVIENIFFIVFLGVQPNTSKYFTEYFKKCNQTLQKNLFSKKYFIVGKYFLSNET